MGPWVDPIPALKQRVADEIVILLEGWTQENGGALLRASQPRVSDIRNGRLENFTLDRLVRYLSWLDRDIEILTTKRPGVSVLRHRDPRLGRPAAGQAPGCAPSNSPSQGPGQALGHAPSNSPGQAAGQPPVQAPTGRFFEVG